MECHGIVIRLVGFTGFTKTARGHRRRGLRPHSYQNFNLCVATVTSFSSSFQWSLSPSRLITRGKYTRWWQEMTTALNQPAVSRVSCPWGRNICLRWHCFSEWHRRPKVRLNVVLCKFKHPTSSLGIKWKPGRASVDLNAIISNFSWERGCRGAPGLHGGLFSEEPGFEQLREWKLKVPDGLHLVHEATDGSRVRSR